MLIEEFTRGNKVEEAEDEGIKIPEAKRGRRSNL
jgi:hypothetical protein